MTTENPPSSDMIKETSKSVDLSPDQLTSLFGDGHECVPGESYTIVLKAGDKDESGYQNFTVDKSATEKESSPEDMSSEEDMSETETEEPTSSDEEKSAFGYDREKLMARRRKQAPKLTAKDLEMD
jgi:hypothetical protein